MKNRGFTLTELLGVIVLIAIIGGLAVISVNYVIQSGKKGIYKNYETTLKGAAENYFIDHIDNIPTTEKILTITELESYLDELKDPNGGDCNSSYVKVTRGADLSSNFSLNYQVCLICKLNGSETYTSDAESETKFCH